MPDEITEPVEDEEETSGSGEEEESTETTYEVRKFSQLEEVPAPDGIMSGYYTADIITLSEGAGLKRGTLLMSEGSSVFVAATSAGIADAYELAVLTQDVPEDAPDEYGAVAYFTGIMDGASLVLDYEEASDVHSELVEAIRPALRRAGFTVL